MLYLKIFQGYKICNKLLLPESKTQLLIVINYYFFQTMFQGRQKKFFYFFKHNFNRTHTVASTSKNSVASTRSQSHAQLTTGHRHFPGMEAPSVIIYY